MVQVYMLPCIHSSCLICSNTSFLAFQSTFRKININNTKIVTTPFGSGTGDEGYSNTTSEKSKDKSEILGSCVIAYEINFALICICITCRG